MIFEEDLDEKWKDYPPLDYVVNQRMKGIVIRDTDYLKYSDYEPDKWYKREKHRHNHL